MNRVQDNLVSRYERRFLTWACAKIPAEVTPDHLTGLGVFGAILAFAGYAAAQIDHRFLWIAPVGYVLHWLGDSLDGSLARFRNTMRPRYGYFLDHSVDAVCIILMIGGMGLSPFVRLDVALFVVLGYFALSIHVFLRNHVTGTFQLSFMALGPTELRLAFVIITFWMIGGGMSPAHMTAAGISDYDICLIVIGGVFFSLFFVSTGAMIRHLRALEGNGRSLPIIVDATSATARRPRGVETAPETLRAASPRRGF